MKKKLLSIFTVVILVMSALAGCTSMNKASNDRVLGIIGAMEEEVEILKAKMEIKETIDVAGMKFYKGKLDGKI